MKAQFNNARFHVSIEGDTQEIRDCLRDLVAILHDRESERPMQLRSDMSRLANIVDLKTYAFSEQEIIAYNRHRVLYKPNVPSDAVQRHYEILKRLWQPS